MYCINTCIDTAGQPFTRQEPFFSKFKALMEVTDLLLVDVKHIDPEAHRRLTGQPNANILDMFRYLSEIHKPIWVRQVLVPPEVMASISPAKTPQGVLFTCRVPVLPVPETLPGRRYVVLDGVQDPGNVGTVLRTLDAFDADGLLLTGGCADPFGPKTVRASMGAVFRRPVWSVTPEELGDLLRRSGIPLYGAALRDDTEDARALDLRRCAIAIGSEGRGLTEQVLALCDRTVRIPMEAHCESLNAAMAAAVLLWEAYR